MLLWHLMYHILVTGYVQAAGPQSSVPVSAESSDFSVPPAPAAPSEDTATIESFGDAEPVPVPEAVSDSSSNAYAPPPPTVTSAS